MTIYLWLMIFTLVGPLSHSWDKRIYFYKGFPQLFPAITVTAIFFLVWDYFFVQWGVWGFNPKYLLGPGIGGLPLEEILFFFIVPFACVFLYEVAGYYIPQPPLARFARPFSLLLAFGLTILSAIFYDRVYTLTASLTAIFFLVLHVVYLKATYLPKFYLGYAVSLIPFFLVNGILTGTMLEEPVVWYNNSENLGVRMGTIPVDDSIYLLALLLSVITIYEELKAFARNAQAEASPRSSAVPGHS